MAKLEKASIIHRVDDFDRHPVFGVVKALCGRRCDSAAPDGVYRIPATFTRDADRVTCKKCLSIRCGPPESASEKLWLLDDDGKTFMVPCPYCPRTFAAYLPMSAFEAAIAAHAERRHADELPPFDDGSLEIGTAVERVLGKRRYLNCFLLHPVAAPAGDSKTGGVVSADDCERAEVRQWLMRR